MEKPIFKNLETEIMDIKESRVDRAVDLKKSGDYNCCQAVACAYSDITGLDAETLRRVGGAFGTGFGSTRGTCGALVGAGLVLGALIPDRVAARSAMRDIINEFEARNGCTICRDLKGIDTGKVVRECNDCVADAARMLEEQLKKI